MSFVIAASILTDGCSRRRPCARLPLSMRLRSCRCPNRDKGAVLSLANLGRLLRPSRSGLWPEKSQRGMKVWWWGSGRGLLNVSYWDRPTSTHGAMPPAAAKGKPVARGCGSRQPSDRDLAETGKQSLQHAASYVERRCCRRAAGCRAVGTLSSLDAGARVAGTRMGMLAIWTSTRRLLTRLRISRSKAALLGRYFPRSSLQVFCVSPLFHLQSCKELDTRRTRVAGVFQREFGERTGRRNACR